MLAELLKKVGETYDADRHMSDFGLESAERVADFYNNVGLEFHNNGLNYALQYASLEDGRVDVDINGETLAFDEDVLLISYNAKPGMHVVSENGVVVSLDLNITDALRQEGLARDIVRNIQDARKSLNYNITDRITIAISGDLPEASIAYICGETLAQVGDVAVPETTVTVEGEGKENITIAIARK